MRKRDVIRILIAAGLMAFILTRLKWGELYQATISIKLEYLFIAFVLNLFMVALSAYRWRLLIGALGLLPPFKKILSFYFVGIFFNTFTPGSMGGDVIRIFDLSKIVKSKSLSLTTVVIERVIGLFTFLCLALILSIFSYQAIKNQAIVLITLLITMGCFLLAFIFTRKSLIRKFSFIYGPILKYFHCSGIKEQAVQVYDYLGVYKNHKKVVIKSLFISALSVSLWLSGSYIVALSLDIHVSIKLFFLFVSLIELIRTLPISIHGIGVREGAFILFFGPLGISNSELVLLSMLIYSLLVINGLLGGLFYINRREQV